MYISLMFTYQTKIYLDLEKMDRENIKDELATLNYELASKNEELEMLKVMLEFLEKAQDTL